jgi:hypothetical protein
VLRVQRRLAPLAAARRPHCGSRRRRLQYDGDTARRLAEEAIEHAKGGTIAILSAPSAFKALREIVRIPPPTAGVAISHPRGRVTIRRAVQEPESSRAFIFEYDPRFANFGSAFVKYDFNFPEQIPEQLKGSCDYIMADPPYLNPDAVAKFARTIRLLARRPTEPEPEPEPEPAPAGDAEEGGKPGAAARAAGAAGAAGTTAPAPVPVPVLYLSGAVTRDWVKEELGLRPNTFTPSFA